jgi:ATP-dependent helicase/nuclease subunit A
VPEGHPVRGAMAHLRELWSERWWLGPSALLERLLRERQAFLLGFGHPRPKEVWHRLRFLLDQARDFEESGGGDLRSFIEWAELQGSDGARVHEPLLPDTDDDAVKILTVHGAKGLEFPIAILSGMTTARGTARKGVSVLWGVSGPPEVRVRKGIATANHDPRADIEQEMDEHERLRLLYVAATRARDHLVVSCHHKRSTDTYAGLIWRHFAPDDRMWRQLPDDTGSEPAVIGPVDASPVEVRRPYDDRPEQADGTYGADDRERWIGERAALLDAARVSRVVSATGVARAAGLGDDEAAEPATESEEDAPSEAGTLPPVHRRGRAGTAIGRAVHATLQIVDLAAPLDLESHVRRQCESESIPEHVETVMALVRSALAAPAIKQAARSPHHKELFIAAPLGSRVVEGYIDLLVETPEGLVVIDYKTDSVSSAAQVDAKLAAYELQGAAYAAVLEAVTGQKVVDCRFVFCVKSGAIERSVADLPAAIDRVRETLGKSLPLQGAR